ncbi:hypothetical protein BB561_002922 [Smittium simulii]|uniref:Uncharacterized protein n=1 Tax=Smittium simulii TaxID=133385 RepID=A0A2T9YNM7_9FUNG|nr:hypothetical protein BB561_002922 [Smittium simulii]
MNFILMFISYQVTGIANTGVHTNYNDPHYSNYGLIKHNSNSYDKNKSMYDKMLSRNSRFSFQKKECSSQNNCNLELSNHLLGCVYTYNDSSNNQMQSLETIKKKMLCADTSSVNFFQKIEQILGEGFNSDLQMSSCIGSAHRLFLLNIGKNENFDIDFNHTFTILNQKFLEYKSLKAGVFDKFKKLLNDNTIENCARLNNITQEIIEIYKSILN